ncbi:hypothetical protein EYC84_005644 [Monilinia fructicola]|uniref:Conserved oligomeric Golgi complex subunit 4 n=1 Tax=Monilinia fructicola TaxID=38448 RepID=A0A5M9K2A5_MONFR|nr:hypothetical protein EYC84_005644 [Monilinia fructicola]
MAVSHLYPTTPSPGSAQSSLHDASSLASIQNILSTLHTRDAAITSSLQSLISSQASLSRDLGRLDLLRAHLGTNVINTRAISHGMLDNAASTAEKLSSKVKELDLEKKRVEETLGVVEQVAELKACVNGVVGSMGAPQDWEAAAGYIARASKIPEHIVEGNFAARTVPSVEVPDAPGVTIEAAKESLCGLFLREFEKAAEEGDGIVEGHGGLVERHYGAGKMVRVIERLQVEADVQGGIVLDTWGDEKNVDRRLTDVRSYPFSFLVQSFLPNQRPTGISRTGSPAVGGAANGRANGCDVRPMVTIHRFLSGKCRDPEASADEPLIMPDLRSVEKAFQLDEFPTGLSLNPSKPIDGNAPYIISAVDDVMYIVNAVLKRSISTSQRGVIESVIPAISRVLGTDFVGMVQRKMRDESYPKPLLQGGFPPEDKIIAFIVLINTLDVSNDYISRIMSSHLQPSEPNSASHAKGAAPAPALKDLFPYGHDATFVSNSLTSLNATFSSKTNELISEGLQVMFNNVIKPRLRPVLSETFRDVDYSLTTEDLAEIALQNDTDDDPQELFSGHGISPL